MSKFEVPAVPRVEILSLVQTKIRTVRHGGIWTYARTTNDVGHETINALTGEKIHCIHLAPRGSNGFGRYDEIVEGHVFKWVVVRNRMKSGTTTKIRVHIVPDELLPVLKK